MIHVEPQAIAASWIPGKGACIEYRLLKGSDLERFLKKISKRSTLNRPQMESEAQTRNNRIETKQPDESRRIVSSEDGTNLGSLIHHAIEEFPTVNGYQ
jgi:hypothetical protein